MRERILEFKHICFKYKGSKELLFNQLDFSVKTGELVGILGASGSGKTTLTEILLQRHQPTCSDFQILENGQLLSGNAKYWSYVPQANLLRTYLKVSETFDYYSRIHLSHVDPKERKDRINKTMSALGLSEFSDKKISELSGGQKRRVSIGVELLSERPYFILDEPSSGLDALSDRNLLRTLKILAKTREKSIIVITHNTENLSIFDRIIFLSKGLPKFVGSYQDLLMEFKTTDAYAIEKYLDLNIADLYQELDSSGRIYKI